MAVFGWGTGIVHSCTLYNVPLYIHLFVYVVYLWRKLEQVFVGHLSSSYPPPPSAVMVVFRSTLLSPLNKVGLKLLLLLFIIKIVHEVQT